jgi:hypothetical protein
MTHVELKQAAIELLAKAFREPAEVPSHVVQAAVSIVLTPADK